MRYSFDNIAEFVQFVASGSISAAVLRLNLAESVVSKRIAAQKTGSQLDA